MSGLAWPLGGILLALGLAVGDARPAARPVVTRGGPPDSILVNPRASAIRWSGGGSAGTIAISGGLLVLRHQMLESGRVTADLRRLAVSSAPAGGRLTARAVRAGMTGTGFLDVDRYPTATFVASRMERIGPSRWRLDGTLTLHGVAQPLSVDADVRWPEVGHLVATSAFTLDARRWGLAGAPGVGGEALRVEVTLDGRRKLPEVATGR